MNLKHLDKTQLDQRLHSLVSRERELLHEMVLTIKEIYLRRSYLEFGYPSLFAYLTERMGLSAGSAQRRIEAMRLLIEIPAAGEKIATGELNLQQISLVQKTAREAGRISIRVTPSEKLDLLKTIAHKNQQESQKEVAIFFNIPIQQGTTHKIQADESVQIVMTLSKELYEKVQRAQELLSHSVGSRDLVGFLAHVAEQVIRQKTAVRKIATQNNLTIPPKVTSTMEVSHESTSTVEPTSQLAPTGDSKFSLRTKKLIRQQQDCCQYRDPITGKRCGSRWFLHVDHKQSRWADGSGQLHNAQLLCAGHNQLKYHREARIRRR